MSSHQLHNTTNPLYYGGLNISCERITYYVIKRPLISAHHILLSSEEKYWVAKCWNNELPKIWNWNFNPRRFLKDLWFRRPIIILGPGCANFFLRSLCWVLSPVLGARFDTPAWSFCYSLPFCFSRFLLYSFWKDIANIGTYFFDFF